MLPVRPRESDAGFGLVELLVAIGLFAVVGTVALAIGVQGMRVTSAAQSRAVQSAALDQAVERVAQVVQLSAPVGIATATEFQADVHGPAGTCRRVRFATEADPAAPGKLRLVSYTARLSAAACATDHSLPVTGNKQVLIGRVTPPPAFGAPLFGYVNAGGASTASTAAVAAVAVRFQADIDGPGRDVVRTANVSRRNR